MPARIELALNHPGTCISSFTKGKSADVLIPRSAGEGKFASSCQTFYFVPQSIEFTMKLTYTGPQYPSPPSESPATHKIIGILSHHRIEFSRRIEFEGNSFKPDQILFHSR